MAKKTKAPKDDFLLSQGQALYNASKSAHELMTERMRKDMELYDGEFSESERKWSDVLGAPRLFINKTYTNVNRIHIDAMEAFYGDPDELVDITSDKDTTLESLQTTKALLNYRLQSHPIDGFKEVFEYSHDGIRVGIGAFKVYPALKTETVQIPIYLADPITMETVETGETEEKERIIAYEPRMDAIPPEDIRVSPKATWKNYWKYPIVHRYKRTRDECRDLGYKNYEKVMPAKVGTTSDVVKAQRLEGSQSPFESVALVKEAEEIWVFECWDFLPGEDGKLKSGSYILLGDENMPSVVGRGWEENKLPYKFSEFEEPRPPFVLGFAYPEPHRLKGKSFPEITESNQREINAIANQEREAVARAIRPSMYINKQAEIDLVSITNRRIGGYIQGDGPASEAMREIQMSNPLALTQGQRARVDQDYWEAGIPPNLLGTASGEDTATGANQQLQNANKKVAQVVKNLAYTGFITALRYLLRLEQVYVSDEFVRKVTGKVLGWRFSDDNFPASDLIQGDFDLKVNLGINKRAQMNQLFLMTDRGNQYNQVLMQQLMAGVVSPQQAQFFNSAKALQAALPVLGFKNSAEWMLPAMPPMPQGQPKGVPSQPTNLLDASQSVSQMSPQAPEALPLAG